MFNAAKLVQEVNQCAYGMLHRHARPGKTHCSLHLLTLQWFVAMDGTLGTGRFGRTVRAFLQAFFSVTKKGCASFTRLVFPGSVMA